MELYELDECAALCGIQLNAIQLNNKVAFLKRIDVYNLCDYFMNSFNIGIKLLFCSV